jgi:hypothetical protein
MEEYGDIYYVDDARNASRDHRTHGGAVPAGYRPGTMVPGRTTRAVVVQQPTAAGGYRPAVYAPAPVMYPEQSTAGSLLGRLTIAQLIEMAALGYAAIMPLPTPPNPSQETVTNTQNLILYQTELAKHAKRDEQVRTLAALVARLAG